MNASDRQVLDEVLKRRTLSHADVRRVEALRDDGFDHVRHALDLAEAPALKVNGLRLLLRLGNRVSDRTGGPRLAEVFHVAESMLRDADEDVRSAAARVVAGIPGLLRAIGGSVETIGGEANVLAALGVASSAVSAPEDRELVERAIASVAGQGPEPLS